VDNSIWKRLQVAQNKAIRAALGLPNYTSVEYIHQISNLPKAIQYATTLLERAIARAKAEKSTLIENLLSNIAKRSS
jgi:hypothetical protein